MSDLTVRNIRPHAGGNRIRKSRADRIFDIVIYTVAVLLTLLALYPMYFIVIASVSDPNLVAKGDVLLFPRAMIQYNYSIIIAGSCPASEERGEKRYEMFKDPGPLRRCGPGPQPHRLRLRPAHGEN